MPRLTDRAYYARYRLLRNLWLHDQRAFALLDPSGQALLQKFYQPKIDHTLAELKAHRRRVTAASPSLPNRASKLYALIVKSLPVIDRLVPGQIRVVDGVVIGGHPESVRRVARACIALARWQRRQKYENS